MLCLIRVAGRGRYWAHYRRLAHGAFLAHLLLATGLALLLRDVTGR